MQSSRVATILLRRLAYDQRIFSGVRCLYTPQFLNMDKYVEGREFTQKQYGSMKENFLKRMKQQMESSDAQMVFTDDLKSVVHLCEGTPGDLEICVKMMKRFHSQNKELRFGTFIFGPVVMRMLYHLKATDLALQLLKDEELSGFFDQLKSFFLVMDMLFKEERYQDILDLNNLLQNKQLLDTKFPRDCVVLVCAACYKMNTPESFSYATTLLKDIRTAGADIIQKALHFLAALSLNQNRPDVAMELLSSLQAKNNIIANNLKLVTLAKLNRLHEAFQLLQRKLEEDVPSQSLVQGDICQSTHDVLQQAVEASQDTEMRHQFDQLSRSLKEGAFISAQSIDELLMVPVAPRPMFGQQRPGVGYGGQRPPRPPRGEFGRPDNDFPTFQRREPFRRQSSEKDGMRRPRMQQNEFDGEEDFPNSRRREPIRHQSSNRYDD